MLRLDPGPRRGTVTAPPSKSHEHRLLVANFLAGERTCLADAPGDAADILATKRCLRALATDTPEPILDCGESGSTLRFLAPVAAALGKTPRFVRSGRLAERPFREYRSLEPGEYELPGDVSSQFVTGLLFALPLLCGDSRIRFSSPLESRGYVDMTRDVLAKAGIVVKETEDGGYVVPGRQNYREQPMEVEGDWSGAAFWCGMNALGSQISVEGLRPDSAQPDRVIADLLQESPDEIDVSQCPDIFPVLAMVAAGKAGQTVFRGIRRLRLKECDRVAAMVDVLGRFGVGAEAREETFTVEGTDSRFRGGGEFTAFGDHRIAMTVAVGATRADGPVFLDDPNCVKKSYPGFFDVLQIVPVLL